MSDGPGKVSRTPTPSRSPASTPQSAVLLPHGLVSIASTQGSPAAGPGLVSSVALSSHLTSQPLLTSASPQSQSGLTFAHPPVISVSHVPGSVCSQQVLTSHLHSAALSLQQMPHEGHKSLPGIATRAAMPAPSGLNLQQQMHSVAATAPTQTAQSHGSSVGGQPGGNIAVSSGAQSGHLTALHNLHQQGLHGAVSLAGDATQHQQVMSMVSGGVGGQPMGSVVRVTLPINLQGVQHLHGLTSMQQLQPGMAQFQNVQHIQGMQQMHGMQGMQQMQGLQQMAGVQQLHGLQQLQAGGGAQGFPGLAQGVHILQQQPFLTQQLPGQQALFTNQHQLHAFSGSVVSPALSLQHMHQQQAASGGKSPSAGGATNLHALSQVHALQVSGAGMVSAAGLVSGAGMCVSTACPSTPTSITSTSRGTLQCRPVVSIVGSVAPTSNVASNASGKGTALNQHLSSPLQQQQNAMLPPKATQLPRQPQPLVIGQIGVISNQGANNATLMNQKSPILAQANPAQVIGSPTQIRFQNPGVFGNNQILQPVMSVSQLQQMGLPQGLSLAQPIFAAAQGSGQQVYLRPAALAQPQHTVQLQVVASKAAPKEVVGGVQVKTSPTKPLGNQIQALGVLGPRLQMAGGPVRVGAALPQVATPRARVPPSKPKTTSPRVIQPKPSAAATVQAPSNTAAIPAQPKLQGKVVPATRVVAATVCARPTPAAVEAVPARSTPSELNTAAPLPQQLPPGNSSERRATEEAEQAERRNGAPSPAQLAPAPSSTLTKPLPKGEEDAPTGQEHARPEKPTAVVTSVPPVSAERVPIFSAASNLSAGLSVPTSKSGSVLETAPAPRTERKQAIVKPVLTHVIEGFIIQEATEPFPIQRSHLLENQMSNKPESPDKPTLLLPPPPGEEEMLKCEYCDKVAAAKKFKNSKRFCSKLCTKRYSVSCSKRLSAGGGEARSRKRSRSEMSGKAWTSGDAIAARDAAGARRWSKSSEDERSVTPAGLDGDEMDTDSQTTESSTAAAHTDTPSPEPRSPPQLEPQIPATPTSNREASKSTVSAPATEGSHTRKPFTQWNVSDVASFLRSLPGCDVYVEEFARQEIDGQALSLLKEDHLMSAMNIKLGPALKICASIRQFQDGT